MNTNEIKTYSSKSNAKRAAKAAGIQADDVVVTPVEVNGSHGVEVQYTFHSAAAARAANEAAAKEAKKQAKKAAKAAPAADKPELPTVEEFRKDFEAKTQEQHLEDAHNTFESVAGELGYSAKDDVFVPVTRKSQVKNPVEVVWNVLDGLKAAADKAGQPMSRKLAIATLVNDYGIAFYTARTQYQSWKTANKF